MIIQRRCLQEAFLRDSILMKFPEQLNPQTESRSVEKGGLGSDSVELDGGEACQQCECSRTSACCSSDGHAGTHTRNNYWILLVVLFLKIRSHFAHQAGLELEVILLPQLLKCYGYRYEPPNPASFFF